MEKVINAKIADYINKFKTDIIDVIKNEDMDKTIQFIYAYKHLTINKTDTEKRKRVKNSVPFHERCKAKRANCAQCTRRRRDGSKFCGTHIKGTPHGEITEEKNDIVEKIKVQVFAQEISGIINYLDKKGNIYDPRDIFQNNNNPKIIAKYDINEKGEYNIIS
jgi:hypothetical protein